MRLRRAVLTVILATYACMARGYDLHVGGITIALQSQCTTDHKLNVKIGDTTYCAPMTTETVTETSLRVKLNDTVYTVCSSGTCPGGGGDEVPEIPPAPIEFDPSCAGPTLVSNAYLLSDGRQYFDTRTSVDATNDIEVTIQVINGKNAKIFGTVGSSCKYDMVLNKNGYAAFRIGDSTGFSRAVDSSVANQKNLIKTETASSGSRYVYKNYYVGGTKLNTSSDRRSKCADQNTNWLVLNTDYTTTDSTLSGGIKLYQIVVKNASKQTIHDYRPVPAGVTFCNYTTPQNGMWDTVSKKFYLAGGEGVMGYGVDP